MEIKRRDIIQTKDRYGKDVYSLVLAGPFKNGIFQVARLTTWQEFSDCRDLEVYNAYTKQTEHVNVFSMLTTTWADRVTAIVSTVDERTMSRIAGAMFRIISGMYEYSQEKGYHLKDFSISIPSSMLFSFGVTDEDDSYDDVPFTFGNDGQIPEGPVITFGQRDMGYDRTGTESTKALIHKGGASKEQESAPETPAPKPVPMSKKEIDKINTRKYKELQTQEKVKQQNEAFYKLMESMEKEDLAKIDTIFELFSIDGRPGYIAPLAAYRSIMKMTEYCGKVHSKIFMINKDEFIAILKGTIRDNSEYKFTRYDGATSVASNFYSIQKAVNFLFYGKKKPSERLSSTVSVTATHNNGYVPRSDEERLNSIFDGAEPIGRTKKYLDEFYKFCQSHLEMMPVYAKGIDTDQWINPIDLQMVGIQVMNPTTKYMRCCEALYDTLYKMSCDDIGAFLMMKKYSSGREGCFYYKYMQTSTIQYMSIFIKWCTQRSWEEIHTVEDAKELFASVPALNDVPAIFLKLGIRASYMLGRHMNIDDTVMYQIVDSELKNPTNRTANDKVNKSDMTEKLINACHIMLKDIGCSTSSLSGPVDRRKKNNAKPKKERKKFGTTIVLGSAGPVSK